MTSQQPTTGNLSQAIIATLAYGDIFDFPLTSAEIHRYLIRCPATLAQVEQSLRTLPVAQKCAYFTLPGREKIVAMRQGRQKNAQALWPQARAYAQRISRLPFVRMVALTGSLAVNNAPPNADIDYLIVTSDDRLWLCRTLTTALVRIAARKEVPLCPNYFVTQRNMVLPERGLYIARELSQMVPLSGLDVYHQFRQANAWTADYFPNAQAAPAESIESEPTSSRIANIAQNALSTPLGKPLEQWAQKRRMLSLAANSKNETQYTADVCKGHVDGHQKRVLTRFASRLSELGIPAAPYIAHSSFTPSQNGAQA